MFCKNCGAKLDGSAKFCVNCGSAVSADGGANVNTNTNANNSVNNNVSTINELGNKLDASINSISNKIDSSSPLVKYSLYIGLGGCLLVIIGCFLPWLTVFGITGTWGEGDGKIAIVLAIISGVLMFLKKEKYSLISSGLVAILFFMSFFKIIGNRFRPGIGCYVVLIGIIGMCIYPFVNKKK